MTKAIPNEIEKKFLPANLEKGWRDSVVATEVLIQVYLKDESGEPYRVRLHLDKYDKDKNVIEKSHAVKCYKKYLGEENGVPIYSEKEEAMDRVEALKHIVENVDTLIMKERAFVPFYAFCFEIDTYFNSDSWVNQKDFVEDGLLETIEVEFKNAEDILVFNNLKKPDWLGKDITKDGKYKNSNLAFNPKNEKHSKYIDIILSLSKNNPKPKIK